MSRMPRSSSTSSRRRFIVAEPARPARTVGGLSQGRVASFLAALLEEQIDLLEAFQIFSHFAEVGVALDQLLVELRDLLLELRQLRARRDDRGRRPAAHPGTRHRPVVDVPREELVVGGDRGLVAPLLDEPVRPREQRRRRRRSHERPALRRRAARGEHQYERERRGAVHTRGRSTLNRLPLPSCDSTVTRPPWARATSLTIASPSPVPPRSRCAWRYDSKMWGISPAGIPTPVSSTWSSSSGSASTSRTTTRPPFGVNRIALPARFTTTWRSRPSSPWQRKSVPIRSRSRRTPAASARGWSSSTACATSRSSSTQARSSGTRPARSREISRI